MSAKDGAAAIGVKFDAIYGWVYRHKCSHQDAIDHFRALGAMLGGPSQASG